MKNRISSALKYLALSVTLKRLPHRQNVMAFSTPQPLRQPNELAMPDTDDAWMFEKAAASAVDHRMEMLANEMDRLSGTLSGLRAFLGSVTHDAPLLADYEVTPQTAPLIMDRDLFDGEPLSVSHKIIPAAGEAGYLFDEGSYVLGQDAQSQLFARAA